MSQKGEKEMGTRHRPRVSMIAAIGKNRELGKGNDLIWRVPGDLPRVKELTTGHPIIMGRRTYESIGRPLPGRTNIVVTRQDIDIPGCVVSNSIKGALEVARSIDKDEIFIFGGAHIYTDALGYADRLYLTRIDAEDPEADAFFPEYEHIFTRVTARAEGAPGPISYTWVTLDRT